MDHSKSNLDHKKANVEWNFSNNEAGNLDMIFPEFSEFKIMHLKPNIIDIPAKDANHVYDLILGTETLAKLGVIFCF